MTRNELAAIIRAFWDEEIGSKPASEQNEYLLADRILAATSGQAVTK